MYKMIGDERDHDALLFSLESHAWVPDVPHSSRRIHTQVGKATRIFDKLSSNKSLAIINVSLMRNDKHLVMEC